MKNINSDEVRAQATRVDEAKVDITRCIEWRGGDIFQLVYEEDRAGLLIFIEAELKEARKLSPYVDKYVKELEAMKDMINQ